MLRFVQSTGALALALAPLVPSPSTPPVLLDGIAHVGSHDGRIYAVNALNGDLL